MVVNKRYTYFLGATVAASVIGSSATAQALPSHHRAYGVSDWQTYVPEREIEYKTYRMIVIANPSYSDEEKAAKIVAKYKDIQEEVRQARLAEYAAVTDVVGVGNSCTKGSSGGASKNCAAKCATSARPHMYTSGAWARGAWNSGDMPADARMLGQGNAVDGQHIANESQVCAIALKQSGKGRKASYSEAIFKIKPNHIQTIIRDELPAIMKEITDTPV